MSTTNPNAQPWIVSAVPADGSAIPYSRAVTATGARSAIREAASNGDSEALDRIAGYLSGGEWDADAAVEVAAIVRSTGREVLDIGEGSEFRAEPDDHECGLQDLTPEEQDARGEAWYEQHYQPKR